MAPNKKTKKNIYGIFIFYFRYFKGDIKVGSVDGFGTDVYVYLQRLSHLAQETINLIFKKGKGKCNPKPVFQYFFLNLILNHMPCLTLAS